MNKPNELKIENLIKFPVRSEGLRIFDAENKAICVETDDCSINETEALCDFIAAAINKAAALESENAKLKNIIERLSKAYNCGTSCNADTLKCVKQMDNAKNHPEWYGDGYRNEILKGEKLCLVCAAFTALEGKND